MSNNELQKVMRKYLKLNGVLEAALNRVMNDEEWLESMAADTDPAWDLPNTAEDVFRELEEVITEILAHGDPTEFDTPYKAVGYVPIKSVDNRDERTTWLWLNELQYVEVDPVDIYNNMLENCQEDPPV